MSRPKITMLTDALMGSAGAQNATRQVGVLHPRHTARTNTNTSAATMIQINAGSFSYMAAGQYAGIGRCLWKLGKAPAGG